jgi:hypothetical protein
LGRDLKFEKFSKHSEWVGSLIEKPNQTKTICDVPGVRLGLRAGKTGMDVWYVLHTESGLRKLV